MGAICPYLKLEQNNFQMILYKQGMWYDGGILLVGTAGPEVSLLMG
jgi:hypothetical protein